MLEKSIYYIHIFYMSTHREQKRRDRQNRRSTSFNEISHPSSKLHIDIKINYVDLVTDQIAIIQLIDNSSQRLHNLLNRLNVYSNKFCSSTRSLVDPIIFPQRTLSIYCIFLFVQYRY